MKYDFLLAADKMNALVAARPNSGCEIELVLAGDIMIDIADVLLMLHSLTANDVRADIAEMLQIWAEKCEIRTTYYLTKYSYQMDRENSAKWLEDAINTVLEAVGLIKAYLSQSNG